MSNSLGKPCVQLRVPPHLRGLSFAGGVSTLSAGTTSIQDQKGNFMKRFVATVATAALAAASMTVIFASPASAEVMVSGRGGFCFDVNTSTNQVALWTCHGGANQNFFTAS